MLTIHRARILRKKPLEKTFLEFKKWVKSIQTAGYNGTHMVHYCLYNGKNIKHLTNNPPIQNEENLCQSVDQFVIEYSRYNLHYVYKVEEIQVM